MYPSRLPFIDKIVEERFDQMVDAVVKQFIEQAPPGGGHSGDASLDLWEEYKDQVQTCHSIFFDQYEDLIYQLCAAELAHLSPTEYRLLWLWCDRYEQWNEEIEPDYRDYDLKKELFQRVKGRAMNEEFRGYR